MALPNEIDRKAYLQHIADCPKTLFWMTDVHQECLYLFQERTATPAERAAFSFVTWLDFVHPEDLRRLVPLVSRAREAEQGYKVKYRLLRSDGSERLVLGIAEPRFDSAGRLLGYIGTVSDIADAAGEHAVFTSTQTEQVHRLVAENSSDLISHLAPDSGQYLYISPSVRTVAGYEPAELLGLSCYDIIHPDDAVLVRDEVRRQMQGHAPSLVEHRVRIKSGDYLWFGSNIALLFDASRTSLLGSVVVSRNIHRERQALEELRRSEERFRGLTALSSDWYWESDADGRMTFASEGVYRLLGTTPDRVIGRTRIQHAADRQQPGLVEYAERVARREPFREIVYSVAVHATGTVRHVAISGQPVFEGGRFLGYRGVGRDITREIDDAQRVERLARTDSLTGLPNRMALRERLQSLLAEEGARALAVLFIDLDRFKELNDSMGHAAGDVLLQEVARRFVAALGEGDVVARLGGDEFIVCTRCDGVPGASAVVRALFDSLAAPVAIDGVDVFVQASIGVSLAPDDGTTEEALFRNADIAMYQAKAAGRNRHCFFTAAMGTQARARMALETAMRHALERHEYELHYQPRLDLKTMTVTGLEALIRWNHPVLGRVSPLEFIPLAEERGHIEAIGQWVLAEACRQTRQLSEKHGLPLQVSVNISARQLRSKTLVHHVAHALAASGLPAARLELELTETALVEDIGMSVEVFRLLKGLGVSLAVDDFGTGYSGLAYLGRFPLDTLKLDRSFVNQDAMRVQEVIKAFVDMAHGLRLSVVAEGVEQRATLDFLRSVGCDEAQGYLIARPLDLAALDGFLAAVARSGSAALPT